MSVQNWIGWCERLFTWAWETSLSASVLIAVVFLLQRVFRKQLSARNSYLVGTLILLRLLLPAVPASQWSVWSIAPRMHVESPRPIAWGEVTGAASVDWAAELLPPGPALPEAEIHPRATETRAFPWRNIVAGLWVTGVAVSLALVTWQQRRFARWFATQPELASPRVLALLDYCRGLMGVATPIILKATENGNVPILYGWRRPAFLIPGGVLTQLSERELAMVFMHELAHVKRRDILLNWVIISARSLHWFNPLVWLALRRLRADREVVCDAMVLHALAPEERRLYGKTLVKLLDTFAGVPICPSLVPVINNKQEIKRRIVMISTFTPSRRAGWIFSCALIAVFGWFAFTRGADRSPAAPPATTELPVQSVTNLPPPMLEPVPVTAAPAVESDRERQIIEKKRLDVRLEELDQRISQKWAEVDRLRKELRIPSTLADGHGSSTLDPETLRGFERERITSIATAARYQSLYKDLKSKPFAELAQAIPTALPDAELTQLLRDLNTAESAHARLRQDYGDEHPEVRRAASAVATARTQMKTRVEGILSGVEAQMTAQMASALALSNSIQAAILKDAEMAEKSRPYFRAKRELEVLEGVRDRLMQQLLETR